MKNLTQHSLRKVVAVLVGLCSSLLVPAQTVDYAEYFWDEDPGISQATTLTITPGTNVRAEAALTAPATPGAHLLGVRYHGTKGWSPTLLQHITVPIADDASVNRAEYFWDEDPGFGMGTTLSLAPGQTVDTDALLSLSTTLAAGHHQLGLRYQGTNGWSPTMVCEVYKPVTDNVSIETAEYFWDRDPGLGMGASLSLTPGQTVNIDMLLALADTLAAGSHQLGLRYRGTNGWSPTMVCEVYKPRATAAVVASAEYFWNDDPGFGMGTPIQLSPADEISLDDFGVPSYVVHGDAILFIRYRGTNGWSPTMAFPVMVDAEGNYTLNAQAETSMEGRNYQSLDNMMADFCDRGIGGSIVMNVKTTQTDYAFDATDETHLAQIAKAAADLENRSEQHSHETLTFKAAAESGNTLTLTVADANLPTLVGLLAQTRLENVALTINGTAYDFTLATLRYEELCSEDESTPVGLSAISSAVTTVWQAQPHDGSTLSGYAESGVGDLPAMTIMNNGTKADSIAYAVTLKDPNGRQLYTYTYYIKVHARVSHQSFASLTPATGASVDPVVTRLAWSAIGDAVGGYRIAVSERISDNEEAEATETVNAVTKNLYYDIDVRSGYTYTWTVTAIGYCDEMQSPAMTLKGRLLPDLTVTAITLPEAAEAGNLITVTATVKNQGTGATTEGEWTDRLYYVIDSQDFAQAVKAVDVKHTGNLAAEADYTVTFQMQVPYVETGTLRVFVATDAEGKVMETSDDNNRLLSATSATLSPFYMSTADLAVLRQLYNDFGGNQWNGTKWNTASELVANGNWSGVSFDTDGHVSAINLQGRGLNGTLSVATPYIASLTQLTQLNLSRNALTGDPALFLQGVGEQLTSLDLSYNQIDELSAALPQTITALNMSHQHRVYGNSQTTNWPGFGNLADHLLNIGSHVTVDMPAIVGYSHSAQAFGSHPVLQVWKSDLSVRYGQLSWSNTNDDYAYQANSWKQTAQQNEAVVIIPASGLMANSVYPATMHLTRGDANLTGIVDVTDVQRTLNYILNTSNSSTFSLWAANTWTENEAANLINIQDIVCTVNIVLDNQGDGAASRRNASVPEGSASRFVADGLPVSNLFYASGRYIEVEAQDEIAAFYIELRGVKADQVRLLMNSSDWQMQARNTATGVRLLVFSPTGQTLPAGQSQLLRLSANGELADVQAADAMAETVAAGIGNSGTTGIDSVADGADDGSVYDLMGRKVDNHDAKGRKLSKGLYIKNGRKEVRK